MVATIKDVRKVLHKAYKEISQLEKEVKDSKRKKHFHKIKYMLLWLKMIPCDGRMHNFIMPDYKTIGLMKEKKVKIQEVDR